MMGNAILSYGITFLEFILIVEGVAQFSYFTKLPYYSGQCPANLSTLSLSDVSRDEQKNIQNPFLVQCSLLMVHRYDVSSCSSWCDVFASGLKKPERFEEFLEQCNSKFLKSYWPFKLEPVSGKGDLLSITKLINVQPCGLPWKRSFIIDIKICNCTDGVEERVPHPNSPYVYCWWNFGYVKCKSSKRTKRCCNSSTINEPTNETPSNPSTCKTPPSRNLMLWVFTCLYEVEGDAVQHAYSWLKTTIEKSKNVFSRDEQNQKLRIVEFAMCAFEDFILKFCQEQLNKTRTEIRHARDEVDVQLIQVIHQHDKEFSMNDTKGNSIKIPAEDFKSNDSVLLGVMYKNIHELFLTERNKDNMTRKNRVLNTIIMSAVIYPWPKTLEENVTLVFKNLKPAKTENRQCVFWSYPENSSEGWSGEGCYASSVTISETVCVCNHLTHFAVLMDFTDTGSELPRHDIEILEILTYAGLALSLLGNIITTICYLLLTDKHAPLSQIRVSLVASLLAGQITFLAGIGATENEGACVTVAALTQYFFMVAFCWMLVEGIYLYSFVVKVYNVSHKMSIYHGMSWGVPAILVAISLSVTAGNGGVESFVSDKDCWLSSGSSGFWIFVSFVVLIGFVNVVILVRVIKEMASMQNTNDKQIEQVKVGIRACVVLIPLLGVTWLFGVLSPLHKAFIYTFVILNSTQGFFIFVFHCARNTEIRARLKRRIQAGAFSSDFSKTRVKKSSHANQSTVNEVDSKDVIELQE